MQIVVLARIEQRIAIRLDDHMVAAVRGTHTNVAVFMRCRHRHSLLSSKIFELETIASARLNDVLRMIAARHGTRRQRIGNNTRNHWTVGITTQETKNDLRALAKRKVKPFHTT